MLTPHLRAALTACTPVNKNPVSNNLDADNFGQHSKIAVYMLAEKLLFVGGKIRKKKNSPTGLEGYVSSADEA